MPRHQKVSAISGQPTAAVYAPSKDFSVGIRVAGGGSARIQYTLSFPSEVEAGTAIWMDAAVGVVTAHTDVHITSPVTAVRGLSVAGAITLEIVDDNNV